MNNKEFTLTKPTLAPNVAAFRAHELTDQTTPGSFGLRPCPSAGSGVHAWLFATACQLIREGFEDREIGALLNQWTHQVTRFIPHSEVNGAIRSAHSAVGGDTETVSWKHRMKKPTQQDKLRALDRARRESGITSLEQLVAASPCPPPVTTDEFVDLLFPRECLIWAGESPMDLTIPFAREHHRGRWARFPHIVPSPMSALRGLNKENKLSGRCLGNTGPRRFLVLESDELNYDDASAILAWIGRMFPLVAVVYSGNKSLHGWYFVEGVDESEIDQLRAQSNLFWLDPQTFTKCQSVRTPGVVRPDTGRVQRCLYFAGMPNTGGVR